MDGLVFKFGTILSAWDQEPIGLSFEFFVRKILPHDWRQQEVVIDALAG